MQKKVGFASLPPERRKEIARKGGIASQRLGTGFSFNSETGRKAIKKRWQRYYQQKKLMENQMEFDF